MRRLFHLYILWLCGLFVPGLLHAQEAEADAGTPDKMLVCERGVAKCAPAKDDVQVYAKCLQLMCLYAEDAKEVDTTSNVTKQDSFNEIEQETCDTGLRRCNPLRKEPTYYWECMRDTCTNPDLRDRDLQCPAGEAKCASDYATYEFCVKATCRSKSEKGMCEIGRESCKTSLNRYWQCMSNTCLGDVLLYRDPNRYKDTAKDSKDAPTSALDDAQTIRPIRGVHKMYQYPPENVSQESWQHIHRPNFPIIDSPSQRYKCANPGDFIRCESNDLLSCRCASGMPLRPRHGRY